MTKQDKMGKTLVRLIQDGYKLTESYFQLEIKKATSLEAIPTVLGLDHLTGTRFKDFYVDTHKVRDVNTIVVLEKKLKTPLIPYIKLLFSGFTGSGKTTELIRLFSRLQNVFDVIIFSAISRLRIDELSAEALLFEIAEDVLKYIHSNNLFAEDDPGTELKHIISDLIDWCYDKKIIKEKEIRKEKSIGFGLQFLKGIFFNAKFERNLSGTQRTEFTYEAERNLRDLIVKCNALFDYLKRKTGKEALIIIDDLEKMNFMSARNFYVHNSHFLRDLKCKIVLTVPVELIYHPDYSLIQNVFGEAKVLPMIKIKDINGNPFKEGIDCLTEILSRRLDLSLFENECYKKAIMYSGGSIRELFNIIENAVFYEDESIIKSSTMDKSVLQFKDTFASRIQERNDEIKISFEEYLNVLFEIDDGNKAAPQKNIALLDLLRTRSVMKYNGEGFYDTHPLLDSFIANHRKRIKR